MREADAVGELPGATAGDLNGPYGAHQQSKQAEVWQVAQQFAWKGMWEGQAGRILPL